LGGKGIEDKSGFGGRKTLERVTLMRGRKLTEGSKGGRKVGGTDDRAKKAIFSSRGGKGWEVDVRRKGPKFSPTLGGGSQRKEGIPLPFNAGKEGKGVSVGKKKTRSVWLKT